MTWYSWRAAVCTAALAAGASSAACGSSSEPTVGSGGSPSLAGAGGEAALAGAGGEGSISGSGGGFVPSEDFEISVHLASDELETAPTTVGIVTWSLEGETPDEAHIQFGLSDEYGMVAPVDLGLSDFRTLLLGMKPERTYHFRVVATVSGQVLASPDQTLETGAATDLAVTAGATLHDAATRKPGFIVSSYWRGAGDTMAFIADADGEVVWWFDTGFSGGVGQASMSADGESLWMVTASNTAQPLVRVTMDGLVEQRYEETLGSHAIAPVVDDVMAFVDYGETDCDSLFEIDSAGNVEELVELSEAEYVGRPDNAGDTTNCHGNAVRYNQTQDVYAFSSYGEDVFIVPRSGGAPTKLSQIVPGGNASWGGVQHNAQVLADSILVFANFSSTGRSSYFEYSLSSGAIMGSYDPGIFTANYGDVQRLPGGNTLVTFSNAGLVHEVTPSGTLVWEMSSGGQRMGYATWRSSLYGLPDDTQQN